MKRRDRHRGGEREEKRKRVVACFRREDRVVFVLLRIFGEDLNEVRTEVVRPQTLWSSSLEYSGDRNERLEFHGRIVEILSSRGIEEERKKCQESSPPR